MDDTENNRRVVVELEVEPMKRRNMIIVNVVVANNPHGDGLRN